MSFSKLLYIRSNTNVTVIVIAIVNKCLFQMINKHNMPFICLPANLYSRHKIALYFLHIYPLPTLVSPFYPFTPFLPLYPLSTHVPPFLSIYCPFYPFTYFPTHLPPLPTHLPCFLPIYLPS